MGHDGGERPKLQWIDSSCGCVRQTVRSLVFQMELVEKSWSLYADMTTPAPTDHV